jgi:2-keto-3-deoxy-L-rhamnonate aldolase RhmA
MSKLEQRIREGNAPLVGIAAYTYSPEFAEIAARTGFDVFWIEMEHAHIGFREAGILCRIAQNAGMFVMIRIPDSRRENVLRAAELGPDIIDVPMANDPEVVHELVAHSRYAPVGRRGFFGSSRAVNYTLNGDIVAEQRRVNEELCLMVQIETVEAVEAAGEICAADGLDAIFIGPGDLSASLSVPGQTEAPEVIDAAGKAIAEARKRKLIVAAACATEDAAKWVRRGADIVFCGSDIACFRSGARNVLDTVREGLKV